VRRFMLGIAAGSMLVLALVPAAQAHTGIEVGDYILEIGWRNEPAYLGQPNAVQVIVLNHDDESPVLDLDSGALAAVVSTAGTNSPSMPLTPAFDAVERTGSLGEYAAAIVPTAPGDYRFHITGSIKGTDVDLELTSGQDTFDQVQGSSDLEFPAKLPNLGEVATRLDRIDARIAELQSADPGTGGADEALAAAKAAADAARDASAAANGALMVGLLVGGLGLVVGAAALVAALRAGRRGSTAG
jgi:hypothetical protein